MSEEDLTICGLGAHMKHPTWKVLEIMGGGTLKETEHAAHRHPRAGEASRRLYGITESRFGKSFRTLSTSYSTCFPARTKHMSSA